MQQPPCPSIDCQLSFNEIEMLAILCSLTLFHLVISWLVELNLYGGSNAREFRVHPFGLSSCFKSGDLEPPLVPPNNTMGMSVRHFKKWCWMGKKSAGWVKGSTGWVKKKCWMGKKEVLDG